jgi:hypothetical protein
MVADVNPVNACVVDNNVGPTVITAIVAISVPAITGIDTFLDIVFPVPMESNPVNGTSTWFAKVKVMGLVPVVEAKPV